MIKPTDMKLEPLEDYILVLLILNFMSSYANIFAYVRIYLFCSQKTGILSKICYELVLKITKSAKCRQKELMNHNMLLVFRKMNLT